MATTDGFKPRYRQFHPQATVWVSNPLNHDVIFQVADENNNQFQYKLPSNKVSELPGGAVATLGVKALVDELIQNSKDVVRMWEEGVRAQYEAKVIVREKQNSTPRSASGPTGEIDLSVGDDTPTTVAVEEVEEPFADLKSQSRVKDIAAASIAGKKDTIIEEK